MVGLTEDDLEQLGPRRSWPSSAGARVTGPTSRRVSQAPSAPTTARSCSTAGLAAAVTAPEPGLPEQAVDGRGAHGAARRVAADRVGELERLPAPDPGRRRSSTATPTDSCAPPARWLVDWENPKNNDLPAVNQFSIAGPKKDRRPDVLLSSTGCRWRSSS